jgi:hypothetical protein
LNTKAAEQGDQPERRLARFLHSMSVGAVRLPETFRSLASGQVFRFSDSSEKNVF